jgi:hypothetical protein
MDTRTKGWEPLLYNKDNSVENKPLNKSWIEYPNSKGWYMNIVFFFLVSWRGLRQFAWYLTCCTRPGWWMMGVEQSVEWLVGETEVLGENLPQCRFVHHNSHMTWSGLELVGTATNRLS